jgi:ABC-2 type transport system ATP-binding protein
MKEMAIKASDLAKTFPGGRVAVHGLDFTVPRGSVYGLIGRNGAGKTTTLRLLMGLLRPDRGTALVLGHALWNAPREIRQRVSYVSQEQQLPSDQCPAQLCLHLAKLHDRWDHALAGRILTRFGISSDTPLWTMSGGDQRKVAVALAFASNPDVVILDEPAAGLDPIARRQLIEEMVDFLGDGGERTVIFSTHLIADLERVADRIGIMDRGRMVAGGDLESLQSDIKRVQVIFEGGSVPGGFSIPGMLRSRTEGPVLTAVVRIKGEDTLAALRQQPGIRVNEFPLGLEDLFIELLERQPSDDPAHPWWSAAE